MLYDLTEGSLTAVAKTSFQTEKVLERTHLQAAIRDNIGVLGDDLLVIAEEFGDFEATHRRIDLLCVDKSARLVVVELKRTEDGGHMELQALRYAAMISVMTFDDVAKTFATHLTKTEGVPVDSEQARARLIEWLDDGDEEPVVPRQVAIVLASADFSQEVTTTVLWLNEFYGMDIRCVRLSPYNLDGRLLLDVQHVIPLPEAAELTVKLKKREAAVKKAAESAKDFTKFVIRTPTEQSAPLPKRHAMLRMVQAVHDAGVTCDQIAAVLPASKFRAIDGPIPEGESLWDAMVAQLGLKADQDGRWHLQAPFPDGDMVWVLHNNWGTRTQEFLDALSNLTGGTVRAEAQPQ